MKSVRARNCNLLKETVRREPSAMYIGDHSSYQHTSSGIDEFKDSCIRNGIILLGLEIGIDKKLLLAHPNPGSQKGTIYIVNKINNIPDNIPGVEKMKTLLSEYKDVSFTIYDQISDTIGTLIYNNKDILYEGSPQPDVISIYRLKYEDNPEDGDDGPDTMPIICCKTYKFYPMEKTIHHIGPSLVKQGNEGLTIKINENGSYNIYKGKYKWNRGTDPHTPDIRGTPLLVAGQAELVIKKLKIDQEKKKKDSGKI